MRPPACTAPRVVLGCWPLLGCRGWPRHSPRPLTPTLAWGLVGRDTEPRLSRPAWSRCMFVSLQGPRGQGRACVCGGVCQWGRTGQEAKKRAAVWSGWEAMVA